MLVLQIQLHKRSFVVLSHWIHIRIDERPQKCSPVFNFGQVSYRDDVEEESGADDFFLKRMPLMTFLLPEQSSVFAQL